jgi:hypothetical protein
MSADLRTTSSTRALSWDSDLSQLACREISPFTRSECGWSGVWICVVQQTMSTWGAIVWRVFVVSQHLTTQSECICTTHKAEKWCIDPLNGSHRDTEIWQLQNKQIPTNSKKPRLNHESTDQPTERMLVGNKKPPMGQVLGDTFEQGTGESEGSPALRTSHSTRKSNLKM